MKTYIDAELQIVRMNKNDIIVTSTLGITNDAQNDVAGDAASRFRDWE